MTAATENLELPLKGMRKMIADKMHKSLQETAQLTYHIDVDASHLAKARESHKTLGHKVGFEDLFIVALSRALRLFPMFNATIVGSIATANPSINVSVAIALPDGLVAPTIFAVENMNAMQIAEHRKDVVQRARASKLTVPEMTRGTITISNLGITRVKHFTPIINSPQIAIIGLGQIVNAPWVKNGDELCVRPVMGISLTADHRFIDGGPTGDFLTELARLLETEDTFTIDD